MELSNVQLTSHYGGGVGAFSCLYFFFRAGSFSFVKGTSIVREMIMSAGISRAMTRGTEGLCRLPSMKYCISKFFPECCKITLKPRIVYLHLMLVAVGLLNAQGLIATFQLASAHQ